MNTDQVKELLLQAFETEIGGVQVYTTALQCAVHPELREEWGEYLEQTERHVEIVRDLLNQMGIDEAEESAGRLVVRHLGESLVKAMTMAKRSADKDAMQLVATECVVLAETKDHQNWELIGEVSKKLTGDVGKALREAHKAIEEEEDQHLYHTQGWSRELWIESLGMPAVLPPPEEEKDVKTAIGAARAKMARTEML